MGAEARTPWRNRVTVNQTQNCTDEVEQRSIMTGPGSVGVVEGGLGGQNQK